MLQMILNGLFALAALVAILDYFKVKPTQPLWGIAMPLSRNLRLATMLGLVALSLALSGYGFYRSLRPEPRLTAREIRNKDWQDSMLHLTTVSDKHFANERIEVDGNSFHHCTFKNVTLDYRGEKAFDFKDNTFEGSAWLDLSKDLSLDGLMELQIMLGALKPGITVDDKREHVTSFGTPTASSVVPVAPPNFPKSQSQRTATAKPSPPQTQIEQRGTGSAAVGGGIATGPCSNVQVGGTDNQATTNCGSVPFRTLTESQRQGIAKFIQTLPKSVLVTVGGVYGSGDAVSYAGDFLPLFGGRHLDNQTTPAIRTGFPTTFTDVIVATCSEEDSASQYRNAFVDTLVSLGIPAHRANGSKVAPGNLEFLVGFRPQEVKPQ